MLFFFPHCSIANRDARKERSVAWEPGTHFVYCSPAIHLLSPILQKG